MAYIFIHFFSFYNTIHNVNLYTHMSKIKARSEFSVLERHRVYEMIQYQSNACKRCSENCR